MPYNQQELEKKAEQYAKDNLILNKGAVHDYTTTAFEDGYELRDSELQNELDFLRKRRDEEIHNCNKMRIDYNLLSRQLQEERKWGSSLHTQLGLINAALDSYWNEEAHCDIHVKYLIKQQQMSHTLLNEYHRHHSPTVATDSTAFNKSGLEVGIRAEESTSVQSFNLNEKILVKLRWPEGYQYWLDNYWNKHYPFSPTTKMSLTEAKAKANADGYVEFQAHQFMQIFGASIDGSFHGIFEPTIKVPCASYLPQGAQNLLIDEQLVDISSKEAQRVEGAWGKKAIEYIRQGVIERRNEAHINCLEDKKQAYNDVINLIDSMMPSPSKVEEGRVEETISDGFGSTWLKKCPECGENTMQVVRPGKAQCSNSHPVSEGNKEEVIEGLKKVNQWNIDRANKAEAQLTASQSMCERLAKQLERIDSLSNNYVDFTIRKDTDTLLTEYNQYKNNKA